VGHGVPASNLFAVENNSVESDFDTHDEILNCRLPDRQMLKGMKTTERPSDLKCALDEAWFTFDGEPFGLIYLDFLSQPDFKTHYHDCIRKIVKGRMVAPGGVLILNFGKNRCRNSTFEFNKELASNAADIRGVDSYRENAKVLVEAAVEQWDGVPLSAPVETYDYCSNAGIRPHYYTTTVARF